MHVVEHLFVSTKSDSDLKRGSEANEDGDAELTNQLSPDPTAFECYNLQPPILPDYCILGPELNTDLSNSLFSSTNIEPQLLALTMSKAPLLITETEAKEAAQPREYAKALAAGKGAFGCLPVELRQ